MTDARQHSESADPGCPDFELLSCFADGELDPQPAAALEAHLATCTRCAALSARLGVGLAAAHVRRAGEVRADCIDEERLVVYALGGDGNDAGSAIAAHLGGCDGCLIALTAVRQRLGALAAVDVSVPTHVQQRARLALESAMAELAPAVASPRPARVAFLHRWRGALRIPVLVPAALAAGALVMVALHGPLGSGSTLPGEQSRAVAPDSARLRVTAVEAPVRSRPSRQSDLVTTVRRGVMVDVAGVERDWYEVHLDGGRQGWVEREAFE
jgi:hypothetical protein